jgi:hypothetical protein
VSQKLCAFREKDRDFVGALVRADIVSVQTLRRRLDTVPGIDPIALARARGWLGTLPDNSSEV